jgi:hypothetical protein
MFFIFPGGSLNPFKPKTENIRVGNAFVFVFCNYALYCYLCHPLTIQKTGLPISPCARSQVLLGPNSSFCCLNHLKSQKKNHYIFCYSLAWLSVRAVAPVVRESLRAPRATGFGPRPWDGILGQIETAPPMQVF